MPFEARGNSAYKVNTMIDKLKIILKTEIGAIVISVLIGLGFAAMFRKACEGGSCTDHVAPADKDVEKKIFGFNGECYIYNKEGTTCTENPIPQKPSVTFF